MCMVGYHIRYIEAEFRQLCSGKKHYEFFIRVSNYRFDGTQDVSRATTSYKQIRWLRKKMFALLLSVKKYLICPAISRVNGVYRKQRFFGGLFL